MAERSVRLAKLCDHEQLQAMIARKGDNASRQFVSRRWHSAEDEL
jgi:hypothetical protein